MPKRSALLPVALAIAILSSAASAQEPKTGRDRCVELVNFYDRWAIARFENSDGDRNHFRIRARLDCDGDGKAVGRGIAEMEELLARRLFCIPRLVGPPPWYPPTDCQSGPVAAENATANSSPLPGGEAR